MSERRTNDLTATGSAALRVENLSLSYGGQPAFENVALDISRQAVTAIIGPSGCGKTSFLCCLNRLIDLVPAARVTGRVELAGSELAGVARRRAMNVLDPRTDVIALRRRMGMIVQKPIPFPLSIRRNLELPLRDHGVRERDRLREIVEQALCDVGLWNEVKHRLNDSALTLSGGQQQRLCLARALALEPEVLLMDEPCSALDPLAAEVVEQLIHTLKQRLTIVIVTHNLAQARRVADDAALFWMENGAGRLIERGTARQMFEQPAHELTAAYVSGRSG